MEIINIFDLVRLKKGNNFLKKIKEISEPKSLNSRACHIAL
jgi:hypothetical protein